MNRDFLELMMEKTGFPQEAKTELLRCADSLAASGQEAALDGAVEFFYENELSMPLTSPLILDIGERASVSPYTVWLLFLIEAAVPTREAYAQAGLSEEIFWNTFQDLKYKLLECREVQGVWETLSPSGTPSSTPAIFSSWAGWNMKTLPMPGKNLI